MRDWLDNRTGFSGLLKHLLDEPIPSGVGWWFVTGSIVLFLLAVQLVTGIALAFFYSPSPDTAYDSVRFIVERVTFGRLLRGLHFFGASFIVIAAVVHMLRVVASGSYKKPRELNWIVGVLLLLVILFRPAGLVSLILSERERVGNFGRPPGKGDHGSS